MGITRVTRAGVLLAWGVALAASATLAGCGGGGQSSAGAAGATQDAQETSISAIVACYRAHGDPGFPAPVYDPSDGNWHFAISPNTAPAATRQACQRLFPTGTPSPPVPQAQFEQLVRLAECIRQHGITAWPDPSPDGAFPLPPALQTKTPADGRALGKCQRYIPSGGISVYAAPSS